MATNRPPALDIDPPLLNSANPWATTLQHLTALFLCSATGAVTTRTSLLRGFDHQDDKHQYLFFSPIANVSAKGADPGAANDVASLNNLGYSPIVFEDYLDFIKSIAAQFPASRKTFIISVTGTPEEVSLCYDMIDACQRTISLPLAMEINLSCPNIPGAPPPAYDADSLRRYLDELPGQPLIPIGIKTPPYTHANDFKTLISALATSSKPCKISFVTATNTLGSCLILEESSETDYAPQLPGSGVGGMAGPPLHPLALGNVFTIRKMLDGHDELKHVRMIGVGGVSDAAGYRRMKSVGAYAVAVGTALGKEGVGVFEKIKSGLELKE
jgi:dihydroorotate dehydrogenase (fumarate)